MVEEIFTDLAPLAEKNNVTLESTGDAVMKMCIRDRYRIDAQR